MAADLRHPDLHWFFPRPRLKDADASPDEVREDMAEAIADRLKAGGLYEAPGGDEGIFMSTVLAIVQTASLSPAMGRRKVFVIGDAERMVSQEGADQAANAFLKLLEEPLADTTIVLTSSEPGALLPTIRSRVVALRVAPLAEPEVREFLADPRVADRLDLPAGPELDELVRLAGGAAGRLIDRESWLNAMRHANRIVDAATSADRGRQMRVALGAGATGARGKFSDSLEALTVVLHDRARAAAERGDISRARGAARAVEVVEEAKEMVSRNVSPQLLTASLLRQIAGLVG
jgi:DNA polymerase-3 subunit delta'